MNKAHWQNVSCSMVVEACFRRMVLALLAVAGSLCLPGLRAATLAPAASPAPSSSLLAKALQGPLRGVQDLVFCTRLKYDDGHWYANIGYYCDDEHRKAYTGNGNPDAGLLCKWNLRTSALTVLLNAKGGSVRDPQVHYDAGKVLFSLRKAGEDYYHLHEINVDGSGLRQLTSGPFDDYEAAYLPDGGIVFVSTRCKRWVNCWMTQVGIIYRCDGDGSHIEQLSANTEHDNTPWVMPDGRILYTRWEYVDRSQVEFHHLWTMNPDGTGATIFYGNMHPNIVMIDAKPIPGTTKVLASFSPGHGVNEHAGIATVVGPEGGPDDKASAIAIQKGRFTRDPYPVADGCHLAARDNEVVLMDGSGQVEVIYAYKGPGQIHEPRPVAPRPRERLIPSRTQVAQPLGRFVLANVYEGRKLEGVKRGDVRRLLILESLPKQVNFSGGPDLVSWLGTFTLERVLGTVPVESDGSAFFEAPADRQLFFVTLDGKDLSVKRMQSFTSVRPGEVTGCVGCHEHRTKTPDTHLQGQLLATQRPASRIETFQGFPDVLDFTRDIQPILDRHCVKCHNYEKREGMTILAGDLGPNWSHAFFTMFARRLVADGRNGLGNQPPRTIGSSASRLLEKVSGGHHDVAVSPAEWRTLWLWIESGAPYAGTYAGLRNTAQQEIAGRAMGTVLGQASGLLKDRCARCHESDPDGENRPLPLTTEWGRKNRQRLGRPTGAYERVVLENDPIARFSPNILINFTRPELSPLLRGPLSKSAGGFGSCGDGGFASIADPGYQQLLAGLRQGKAILDSEPRFGTPAFKPNPQYIREMKKYGVISAGFDLARQPLDYFAVDQAYWRSLWTAPGSMSN
jgi:hypothetical protein